MSDPMIVGWAVYRDNVEDAALYTLKQEAEAISAAIRWGARVNALIFHPNSPSSADGGRNG